MSNTKAKKAPRENSAIVEEIHTILKSQGKAFNSAVREFYGSQMDSGKLKDGDDTEDRFVEKFKKYRQRSSSSKAKRELSEFLEFLRGEIRIRPAPLLHLVEKSPAEKYLVKLSKEIFEQVRD